ncbi:MAG TPA: hypothetical protein DCQ79_05150, partial [Rhizobiales bacterium]|nr:hypothetical protein [Hyphomicrobiales bacterium]
MAEFIFALLSLFALFALAMNRAPLRLWALAAAVFTLCAEMGLVHGHLHRPVLTLWALLGWLIAGALFALSYNCLLYTSDAAYQAASVDLGGPR